jgi:hypothetical protein
MNRHAGCILLTMVPKKDCREPIITGRDGPDRLHSMTRGDFELWVSFRDIALFLRSSGSFPAVELLAAELRPIPRVQHVIDHLNQLYRHKGLLYICPAVIEN